MRRYAYHIAMYTDQWTYSRSMRSASKMETSMNERYRHLQATLTGNDELLLTSLSLYAPHADITLDMTSCTCKVSPQPIA